MLHPNQFQVNEAWIVFKLNDDPIHTQADGDFDFVALMDAASCFILSTTSVSVDVAEPSVLDAKRLLKEAKTRAQQWPKTLFIPSGQSAQHLSHEAERQGIAVVRPSEDQLLHFIGEAKEGFQARFGGSGR
jgi:hypothetical protein